MGDSAPPLLPWPLAASGVAGLLLVILLGGVIVARRVQSADAGQVLTALPASRLVSPNPSPSPSAGARVAAGPSAARSPSASPVAIAAPAAGSTPAPTVAAVAAATSARGVPIDFVTPTPGGDVQTVDLGEVLSVVVDGTPYLLGAGTPVPTPRSWWQQTNDVSQAEAADLTAAYTRFWQVRAQALLSLDASALPSVMDGSVLAQEQANLDGLRAQNQAQQINVEHHIQIQHATDTDATLRDDYVSYSVPVDPGSNEPLTPTPSTTSHVAYHLQKLNGTWKVVEAVHLTP